MAQVWPHDLMITDHLKSRGPWVSQSRGHPPTWSLGDLIIPLVTWAIDLLSKSLGFLIYKMSKCPCLPAGLNIVSKKNIALLQVWYWNGKWPHVGFTKTQCPLCLELVGPALRVSLSALLESAGCCLCSHEASSSWILAPVPLQWLHWRPRLVAEPCGDRHSVESTGPFLQVIWSNTFLVLLGRGFTSEIKSKTIDFKTGSSWDFL